MGTTPGYSRQTDVRDRQSTLDLMSVAHRYLDAWNDHSPEAIVEAFTAHGTYEDTSTDGPISGEAIGQNAAALFRAFPDVRFDVVMEARAGDNAVAAQWIMRGTNTGPYRSAPPTNRAVVVPGADFLTIAADRILSVRGYFDTRAMMEQLGFQVIVQPHQIGPFSFGTSLYFQPGNHRKPGAFSITAIEVESDEEMQQVNEYSRGILQELESAPGFISAVTGRAGRRGFTVTAWDDSESPRRAMQQGAHAEAMKAFFSNERLGRSGVTSVWAPVRINTLWVRCTSCGRAVDAEKSDQRCECGAPLPEPPAYW